MGIIEIDSPTAARDFEHEGTRYVVREQTEFERDLFTSAWIDVATVVAKHYDIDDLDNLPKTLDRLTFLFTQWQQVTTISGQPPVNLYPFTDVQAYLDFVQAVTQDPALAGKWKRTYDAVNKKATDPEAGSDDETQESS